MGKNILIFSDGTGQQGGLRPDQSLSNIYKLYRAARTGPDSDINPIDQIAFYDAGLGTERDEGKIYISVIRFIRKRLSAAFGIGISRNIADCYEAILKHYEPGDRIYLFGFSRGAYTVRCVADVLALCGIPTRTESTPYCPKYGRPLREIAEEAVGKVYDHGAGKDRAVYAPEREEQARRFRAKYGSELDGKANVVPYCIGVFDTVAALGASGIEKYIMYFMICFFSIISITTLAKVVNLFFGLSFKTMLYSICGLVFLGALYLFLKSNLKIIRNFPNLGDFNFHITGWKAKSYDEHLDIRVKIVRHALAIDETRSAFERVPWGKKGDRPPSEPGEVDWFEQMWFAGNHSDIGGGYPEDESRLSDITLNWMLQEMARIPHPILWDHTKLNLFPSPDGMQHSEIEAFRDNYMQLLPTAWRVTWEEKPRNDADGAPYHPSVMERFRLPFVLQHSKIAPYRPSALKNDPRFKEFYNV